MAVSQTEAEISELHEIYIGTKGLRKRIIQKGISWQTPYPGDEVEVHYSMCCEDGKYSDSSRDKGAPFKFKIGQCEVIAGWDNGIATMKKGERAIFTIPPELAYGDVGCSPLIPPNSTLFFDIEMVSWNTIRDITGDGGILKKIVNEGEGWATPREADEVLVKYEARLENGSVVSKSNEGVEFRILCGHLCPAMGIAVKTMRKGEKAELSVNFPYGLRQTRNGSFRSNGEIQLESNLVIHLELVSWKSVSDVLGDNKVLKKITKPGEGFDRPNEGTLVRLVYVGKLEDGTVFERKGSYEEPFQYTCSDYEEKINEGLDRAILTMKKGEQSIVTVSSDFLLGSEQTGLVSENSVFFYEVDLIDFTKEKSLWKMDTNEKLEACARKKNDGNLLFTARKFSLASKKYEKASMYVEFDHSFTDDEKHQANALRASCNLNAAACKLKMGEYLEASILCNKVLELDPVNIKALFRRAQAYVQTSNLEKAESDIKRALAIDPNDRDLKLEYKKLKNKQKKYVRYETEFCSTMLSKMA